jgi:hypothetical protein
LLRDLSTPDNSQGAQVAEIIQRVRPDIRCCRSSDYDEAGASLAAFKTNLPGRPEQRGTAGFPLYLLHRVKHRRSLHSI